MTIRKVINNGVPCWRLDYSANGKRVRQHFKTKSLAEAEAESVAGQRRIAGDNWLAISPDERQQVMAVWLEMKTAGVSIQEVWDYYRRTAKPRARMTLGAGMRQMLEQKRNAGRRDKYTENLRVYLNTFVQGREDLFMDEIKHSDVITWLDTRGKSSLESRATALNRISTYFSFGKRMGWIVNNPCDAVERISVDRKPARILSEDETKIVVEFARSNPAVTAYIALALFAGVRPEEVDRTTWKQVDLVAGTVLIDGKLRTRRIVHLEPVALSWLKLAQEMKSPLPLNPHTKRDYIDKLKLKLGFDKWPKDIFRHTAASMLLALHRDAAKVALELGNSPAMLFQHYREVVTREAAERFWNLKKAAQE